MQITGKKDIPEIITVEIEKMSNLGFGIAKSDGYVIFVEGACPKDVLEIKVGKKNKNFAYASIIKIITPSPYRVEPFCKMHKICGACQMQFIDYNAQLNIKKEIVQDAMHSIYGYPVDVKDTIPSPEIKNFRCKIQYPVSMTKASGRILAGYYKTSSHELINIKYCPIQPGYCDNIIDFIRVKAQELNITGYTEKKHTGTLRHIVIRSSKYTGKCLVVLVINSDSVTQSVRHLSKLLYENFTEVSGVCVNINTKKTNVILGEHTELIEGFDYIEEKLTDKVFKIAPKTFFQVNPLSADNIFNYVKNHVKKRYNLPHILDAYAGISAFGICLSDVAKSVTTIEEVKESVELAKEVLNLNGIPNVELNQGDAGEFFENELKKRGEKFYDITILDPPRKGCSKESLEYALKLTKSEIVYVSCNPATLARDLKFLKENGCNINSVQPFDMFPHTYHIENVVIIEVNA